MANAGNPSDWQPQEIAANERAYSQHMFLVCKDAYSKMHHGDYNASLLLFELSISGFEKLIQVRGIYLPLLAAICYEGSRVALFGAHNRNKAILLAEKAQMYTKFAIQNNLKLSENMSVIDSFTSVLKSADNTEIISKLYFAGFPATDTDYTEHYAFLGDTGPVAKPLNIQAEPKKKSKLTAISVTLVILAVAMLVTLCITAFSPALKNKFTRANQTTLGLDRTRQSNDFQTDDNNNTPPSTTDSRALIQVTQSEEITTQARETTTEAPTIPPTSPPVTQATTQATTTSAPYEPTDTQTVYGELDVYPPYVTGAAQLMVVYTTGSNLRLRSGNSVDYRVIENLYDGTIVYVLYTSDDWAFVAYGRLYGWVHTDFIISQDDYFIITGTTVVP